LIDVCRATAGNDVPLLDEAPERELRWHGQTGTVIDAFISGLDL
jgi:hypothetical protein